MAKNNIIYLLWCSLHIFFLKKGNTALPKRLIDKTKPKLYWKWRIRAAFLLFGSLNLIEGIPCIHLIYLRVWGIQKEKNRGSKSKELVRGIHGTILKAAIHSWAGRCRSEQRCAGCWLKRSCFRARHRTNQHGYNTTKHFWASVQPPLS